MKNRLLDWDGCKNVRDLGGLKTEDGRDIQWRAVVRGDTPSRLSAAGWSALFSYGIRTIITLRTFGMVEPELDFISPHPELDTVSVEIEDVTRNNFV